MVANLFFEDSTRTAQLLRRRTAPRRGRRRPGRRKPLERQQGRDAFADTATSRRWASTRSARATPRRSAAHLLARAVRCPVVNAGDGRHAHPTQGLLDLLALRERLGDPAAGRVAIVGDIGNSRVARSTLHGLVALGVYVACCRPPTLVSRSFERIAGGPGDAHQPRPRRRARRRSTIMMPRVQPAPPAEAAVAADFHDLFGLTQRRLDWPPAHAAVMHPGLLNRGVEIDSAAADHPTRSVILRQVALGVAVRMAVLRVGDPPGAADQRGGWNVPHDASYPSAHARVPPRDASERPHHRRRGGRRGAHRRGRLLRQDRCATSRRASWA
ncbi:MAG: hypothetical protein U0575_05945 [Phycisphaerales bacterium]